VTVLHALPEAIVLILVCRIIKFVLLGVSVLLVLLISLNIIVLVGHLVMLEVFLSPTNANSVLRAIFVQVRASASQRGCAVPDTTVFRDRLQRHRLTVRTVAYALRDMLALVELLLLRR